ncbi:hypothetical protein K450DRAFT_301281 [Umbelopsis ramanniana AG]|uniref:NADPH--hemoprotein reductase n=1 Tax=Umbelopsis ramanniana AG TaxID=1314678 RepID=A0AAD5HCV0_UMBRA|nr:uncharacterized protein K450DRAFT_301281 [Umbelopsis ramanniana AG]KAI8578279.1 hypothetical protein K450DRAFT_301281 [Umbelopsis ramanniana AG]
MTIYESDKIPGPEPHVLLGNVPDVYPDMVGNTRKLHDKYGPIIRLSLGGHDILSVCDPDCLRTISQDGEYFTKEIYSLYQDLAIMNGSGLVTTSTKDPDWVLAHKLLMPAFSARAMRAYHYKMGETIKELLNIMETFQKSGEELDVSRWMIALALESIGKIGFDYDFDLLKDPNAERHPFTVALAYVQSMIMKRGSTPTWMKWMQTSANVRFQRDLSTLRTTIDSVLEERRSHPHAEDAQTDLLDFMLTAETKEGEKLDNKLIRDNIITFLSAGHNTTSAFLSWTILELCRNPKIAEIIVQEIANAGVKPGEIPTPEQVGACKYLDLVIKESLRMHPPIFAVIKYCQKDCTIKAGISGDEYKIKAGTLLQSGIYSVHHEPKVWPEPDVFNPERFADHPDLHPNAWLPFSDGPRACIGRQFSLQEGKLALVMMLSKFKFSMDDPNKQIGYQVIIAMKPVDLMVRVSPIELPEPTEEAVLTKHEATKSESSTGLNVPAKFPLPPVTFLYGTQTNTSEEYARKLSGQAKGFGFTNIKTLVKGGKLNKLQKNDSAPSSEDDVKVSELLVVVTATYNGYPPDNAVSFDKWLTSKTENIEDTKKNELQGVLYAVFGCGNRDWSSTFQKFPAKIDNGLELLGADRLLPAGVGDASEDIDGDFHVWSANFWSALMQRYGQSASGKNADIMSTSGPMADPSKDFTLEFLPANKSPEVLAGGENRNQRGALVVIKKNRELQNVEKSQRSTRHIEVAFDESEDKKPLYEAGDHLEITPVNDSETVERVAFNLGLVLDSVFQIKDLEITNLSPRSMAANIKGPCTIRNALTYYADLTGTPTRYTLSVLAKQLATIRPDIAERLQVALQPGKETERLKEFLATHRTFVDIMTAFQIKELNFKEFISSVNCIVPRKYSISSGPLEHPYDPSVSVGIVRDMGGPDGKQVYHGLCSGYLKDLKPGTKINAQIKECKSTFRLPEDDSKPVIFICAGTGMSPFRGFLQERHAKGLKSHEKGGNSDAIMFFGCRHPEQDFIYKEELESYVEDGTLAKLFTTFSRSSQVVRYVQHSLLQHAQQLYDVVAEQGANIYVCGSAGSMAKDVKRTWERIIVQMSGMSEPEAEETVKRWVEEGRYNEDVWG